MKTLLPNPSQQTEANAREPDLSSRQLPNDLAETRITIIENEDFTVQFYGNMDFLKSAINENPNAAIIFNDPRMHTKSVSGLDPGIPVTLAKFVELNQKVFNLAQKIIDIEEESDAASYSISDDFNERNLYMLLADYAIFGNRKKYDAYNQDIVTLCIKEGIIDADMDLFLKTRAIKPTNQNEELQTRALLQFFLDTNLGDNRAAFDLKQFEYSNDIERGDPERNVGYNASKDKIVILDSDGAPISHICENKDSTYADCRDFLRCELEFYKFDQKKTDFIMKCFDAACAAHYDQERGSGEPYILHPLRAALTRISNGCTDEVGIGMLLLHDALEDRPKELKAFLMETIQEELTVWGKIKFRSKLYYHAFKEYREDGTLLQKAKQLAEFVSAISKEKERGLNEDITKAICISLLRNYGVELSEGVKSLTKPDAPDSELTKAQQDILYFTEQLAKVNDPNVILNKAYDRLDNLQTIGGLKLPKYIDQVIETSVYILPVLDRITKGDLSSVSTAEQKAEAEKLQSLVTNEILRVSDNWAHGLYLRTSSLYEKESHTGITEYREILRGYLRLTGSKPTEGDYLISEDVKEFKIMREVRDITDKVNDKVRHINARIADKINNVINVRLDSLRANNSAMTSDFQYEPG